MHQGLARHAGHFTHVELAVFFPGSTKCKSITTVRTCVWQQIQVSKRLVPTSPFTRYTFHGFATRLSGCIIIFLRDVLLVHLDYMDYQQDSVVGENPPSELRGQLPTGSASVIGHHHADTALSRRQRCVENLFFAQWVHRIPMTTQIQYRFQLS